MQKNMAAAYTIYGRLLPLAISLLLALVVLPCTGVTVSDHNPPPSWKPLVFPITKDPNTSLYTITVTKGAAPAPLVVDLAGSLVWSTCPSTHTTVPCESDACRLANRQRPPRCRYVDAGWFGANREPGSGCACTALPFNPVTGECSAGDLTTMEKTSASAADPRNTPYPAEDLPAVVGACAPPGPLLRSLPAGAAGVAGLSRWPLSLPSQLSSRGNRFALCLPGFALFGNASVNLGSHLPADLASAIPYAPLVRNPPQRRALPPRQGHLGALGRAGRRGRTARRRPRPRRRHGPRRRGAQHGGAVSEHAHRRVPLLRNDVRRRHARAERLQRGAGGGGAAVRVYVGRRSGYNVERVAAVPPFELCYNVGTLRPRKMFGGYEVPAISLELLAAAGSSSPSRSPPRAGAATTTPVENYMVLVNGRAACVAVVEMGHAAAAGMGADDQPAVVLGGMQLEERLLVFDLDDGVLGFSDLMRHMATTCGAFNFTAASS